MPNDNSSQSELPAADPEIAVLAAVVAAPSVVEAELRAEVERLKSALHTDQTGLAAALERIQKTVQAYAWVAQGRGPYEWDDPQYRKEMGRMVEEIIRLADDALRASGDHAHVHCCGRKPVAGAPTDQPTAV